jgi:hypothetical protein
MLTFEWKYRRENRQIDLHDAEIFFFTAGTDSTNYGNSSKAVKMRFLSTRGTLKETNKQTNTWKDKQTKNENMNTLQRHKHTKRRGVNIRKQTQ